VLAIDATSLKAFVAPAALLLLVVIERVVPATRAGRAAWSHDLRNASIGALNGALGVGLALWVLPELPAPGNGLLGVLALGGFAAGAVAFVLLDLWMYGWHRSVHAVPLLWRAHRMHHSDEHLDATSALRFHPLETTVSQALRLPLAWALGIGSVHVAVYEAVFLPIVILHHSNVRLPRSLERALGWVVVMPVLHRVHHFPIPSRTHSNFGSVLSAWDRLLRTFHAPPPDAPRFGLDGFQGPRWQRFTGLLLTPFRRAPR
jgi:sterol desaturase/sphingolipid hydroxylase (fatty acid hydroxylase superfamily)